MRGTWQTSGDSGRSGAVIALIAFIVLAVAGGAGHKALAGAAHDVGTAFEVILWTIAGIVIAAAAGGAVYAVVRIRKALRGRCPYQPLMRITPDRRDTRCLPDGTRPAIDPPRPAPSWPLAGRWDEVRPSGGDDVDRRLPRMCGAAPAA